MKNALIASLVIGTLIAGGAAPATAAKKPVKVRQVAVTTVLGSRFSSADLDRIVVGNQAGILKVYDRSRKVAFMKEAAGTDMTGIDGTQWAPVTDRSRRDVLAALDIPDDEAASVSGNLIGNYGRLRNSRAAIAMLGLIGASDALPPTTKARIRAFLDGLLNTSKDVSIRRQAVLSLALCADTDEATVRNVIDFMRHSHNAWETFTTRQYFEYHRNFIRALQSAPELKRQLGTTGNPYSGEVIGMFDQ